MKNISTLSKFHKKVLRFIENEFNTNAFEMVHLQTIIIVSSIENDISYSSVSSDCILTIINSVISYKNMSLRKHAYSNIMKILPPKNENFQIKHSDIFYNSAQNIDCGYSLEPPR